MRYNARLIIGPNKRVNGATDFYREIVILRLTKIIALLVLALPTAGLTESAPEEEEDNKPLWEWNLAAFGRYGPAYPASEEQQFNLIPLPFPVYRGKVFRFGEDTESPIKSRLFRRDRVKLDISFDLNFASDSDDIEVRKGMPDLDFMIEVGPELEFQFNRKPVLGGAWFFSPELKLAASFDGLSPSYRGFLLTPEFQYRIGLADGRSKIKVKISPNFATEDYMDYYYQVDPEFATAQRPAFDADSGYLGTDLSLSWRHSLTEAFDIVLGTRFGFHQGATNDNSPLFTDDLTTSVYAAFMWKFWESKRRAPAED
jgi:outer membrane protein